MKSKKQQLLQDIFIILISVAIAFVIARMGLIHLLITFLEDYLYFSVFVSGMFFTSIFTTPFAIVVLGEFALTNNIFMVAILGGLGAMAGDYVIFRFFKDHISEDFNYLLTIAKIKRLPHIFLTNTFRWFAPFIGALIIASPLPDEVGVAILGLSKLNERTFLPISFCANTLGILVIGFLANQIIG